MLKKHHIIYVPGILDDAYNAQSTLVRFWRLYGVRGHCHVMPWAGDESYEPKFQRLLDEIDRYADQGDKVSLVGASAGVSAILNAYVERPDKIHRLVYICAKINGPETVDQPTYDANPAFKVALAELQINLKKLRAKDKAKMLSLYSPSDRRVPYAATVIEGVEEQALPSLRHGYAIIYAISFGSRRYIMRFLK